MHIDESNLFVMCFQKVVHETLAALECITLHVLSRSLMHKSPLADADCNHRWIVREWGVVLFVEREGQADLGYR